MTQGFQSRFRNRIFHLACRLVLVGGARFIPLLHIHMLRAPTRRHKNTADGLGRTVDTLLRCPLMPQASKAGLQVIKLAGAQTLRSHGISRHLPHRGSAARLAPPAFIFYCI
jgi:hypothetical protein